MLAKSALNKVPGQSYVPFGWTINPYRGCTHACLPLCGPTHQYLDLDAGDDFDRQIIVKVNVAEVLRRELARPAWRHEPVALGSNTDPYQRAEGRYSLMPGIIEELAGSGTPFSVLTKGTLLRRDLPLLVAAREHVPIDLAMSIWSATTNCSARSSRYADHRRSTRDRDGRSRRRVRLLGVPDADPPVPHRHAAHLDEALRSAKAAGATSVIYSALHLRGAEPWFFQWLGRGIPNSFPGIARCTRVRAPTRRRNTGNGSPRASPSHPRPPARARPRRFGDRGSAVLGSRSRAAPARPPSASERRRAAGAWSELGEVDLGAAAPAMLF